MSRHSDDSSTCNTPAELFNTRVAEKTGSPELQALVNATFRFDLSGPQGGSWLVDFRPGSAGVRPAEEEGTCTFSMKDQDFVSLLAGKLNPRMAFMMGTLKVKGDMTVAMKLGQALGAA